MSRPARFLFTTFEGGGHVPPPMIVAARLMSLGHEVLVVSDTVNAEEAARKGLPFTSWRTAPNMRTIEDGCILDDWRSRWPPSVVKRVCDSVITGPSAAYAADTLEIAAEFRPDAIVSNELLFGAVMAAEAMAIPLALLTANAWCYPTRPDLPPFGPGFKKANNEGELRRDQVSRAVISKLYDTGLTDLNRARGALGLPSVDHVLDQLRAVDRIILGISQSFDFGTQQPPDRFCYAGPLLEIPSWSARDRKISEIEHRPTVLVSFSTTFQDQKPVIARCIKALATLPYNGIVTLGPAVSTQGLPSAANVEVVTSASHDDLVPKCTAIVCHGGHGTLLRPLMHGVPAVVLPMGRDHPENAARLEWSGAGIRLPRHASPRRIAKAVRNVVEQPHYADAAKAIGLKIRADTDQGWTAARSVEGLLAENPAFAVRAA